MWHKMTLLGKVLVFVAGFGFGLATGFYCAKGDYNEGNNITVEMNGKVKEGSEINLNLDTDQTATKDESKNKTKEKKFLGLF